MSGDDTPIAEPALEDRLPLLENGKALTTSKPATRRGPNWSLRLLSLILVLLLGGFLGLYFQGPALRALFDWTSLKPGAGARQPIALPVDRVPSPERIAAMALGDVSHWGACNQPAGLSRSRCRKGLATPVSTASWYQRAISWLRAMCWQNSTISFCSSPPSPPP